MSNKKKTRATKIDRLCRKRAVSDAEIRRAHEDVVRDLEDNYGWKFLRDPKNPDKYTILRKGRLPD